MFCVRAYKKSIVLSRISYPFNMCIYIRFSRFFLQAAWYKLSRGIGEMAMWSRRHCYSGSPLLLPAKMIQVHAIYCVTRVICTYLGSESIVAPLARATASWLLELPRPDHESPLSWHDSGLSAFALRFLSVSPTTGFYGDGYDGYACMCLQYLRMLCAWAHGKYVRAWRSCARERRGWQTDDQSRTVGFPWETRIVRLARSSAFRSPYANVTVGDREKRVERELNFCLTGQPANRANRVECRVAPKRIYSFARRCRGLFKIARASRNQIQLSIRILTKIFFVFFNRIVLYTCNPYESLYSRVYWHIAFW